MKIFKIVKNKYVLNELISWGWNIFFFGGISIVIFYTTSIAFEDVYLSFSCVFLIKFFDMLQQEKITTIKVDAI